MTTVEDRSVDTIVAISTPPGRGGIGIVRLSGPDAVAIATRLLRLNGPLEHARARFGRVVDPGQPEAGETGGSVGGEVIDEAVVTAFYAPRSYTGETLVEIAAHGAPVVLEAIVAAALAGSTGPAWATGPAEAGQSPGLVRLARPGEFTERAFLSGRLDLTQAEAVHDLIAAQTLDQARVAAQQMGGALSRRVAPAKESLLYIITLLEAGMDFASGELDDVDVVAPAQIAAGIEATRGPLEALAASFQRGQLLRNGAAIAIVGPANAGKSSLFNRLLERERAIVTPLPGTTRDTVEESLALGGIPLRLIDTAGLRDTVGLHDGRGRGVEAPGALDEAERQGIARSHEALADADLVLLVHDATLPLTAAEDALSASLAGRPHLLVANKIDLLAPHPLVPHPLAPDLLALESPPLAAPIPNPSSRPEAQPQRRDPSISGEPAAPPQAEPNSNPGPAAWLPASALTGDGLAALRAAILRELQAEGALAATGALNNVRQQQAVTAALAALDAAASANASGLPHELILMDLHAALAALDSLTGATTPDDILARIFSTFCIGK